MKNLLRFAITSAIIIFFTTSSFAQWSIDEGFENGIIPVGWTIYDVNNDGHQWIALEYPSQAHTGNWAAVVDCYDNNGNDWLITPQVTVQSGDIFNFFAKAWTSTENMNVKLSTTGNAIGNFNVTLGNYVNLDDNYVEYTYDLSAYTGQNVYLAIQWIQDTYGFVVDDVKVGQPLPYDVGMVSIEVPDNFYLVNSEIYPSGTIQNYGIADINIDFDIVCEIFNESNTLVFSDTYVHSGTLAIGATDVITFATAWTPAVAGTYSFVMNTSLAGDGYSGNDTLTGETDIVLHYGTGGPDAMGYYWIDSDEVGGPVYDWIEISGTGTSAITYGVSGFYGDDNFSEPIPFGFDFPFYGINRTYFHADINGELLLAENTFYVPYPTSGWGTDGFMFNYSFPIPGFAAVPALVAPYWDDLFADQGTGDVYFQTFGNAPNRYCVVEWYNLRYSAGTVVDTTLTFEVIFHENGDLIFQYKDVEVGQVSSIPHDFGQSATVAIQNDNADAGLCYLREIVTGGQYIGIDPPGNMLKNEFAIKFYMGTDVFAPIIVHKEEVWNTFSNTPQAYVTITDISEVVSDTLYYNIGSGWQGIAHSSFENPNIYHYQFPSIPLGTTVNYYFAATDGSPNQNRSVLPADAPGGYYTFKILPTNGVDILLATPGNKIGYEDYQNKEYPKYIAALDAAGVTYDIYNWAAYEEYDIPDAYNTIFLYSNSTGHGAKEDTLGLALIEFLDNGTIENPKNIFTASDEMAQARNGLPNSSDFNKFYTAYIRGGYVSQVNPPVYGGSDGIGGPDISGYSYGSMIGMAGSPIGTEGVEIPVYSNTPDVIYNQTCPDWYASEVTNPEISSWGSYLFEDGPYSGNAFSKGHGCALWLDNLIYKSYFISFDISQFSSDTDINNMIDEALVWFGVEMYTITAIANPTDGGTITGAGAYNLNTTATLTATSATGYGFINWTEGTTVVSTDSAYSFIVTGNRDLVANFSVMTYEITAVANPLEGGTVTGAGTYNYNATATLTATSATGYGFINWTEGTTVVSTDSVYSFIVTDNRDLVANFSIIEGLSENNYSIALNIFPNPNKGIFNLNVTFKTIGVLAIEIINMQGRKVKGYDIENVAGHHNTIDISNLPKGIYLVKISSERNNVTKKVIVK
ncbi:MAG: choice-of-anchor J domain-containing protein [Lentimicrobium sp.]|nr:choice-of-anchor J domain-containing protein [Lentimicrobium sp.]